MKRILWQRWISVGAVAALAVTLLVVWTGPVSPADVAAGQAIYKQRCLVCHGATGKGDTPMAKRFKNMVSFADDQYMKRRSDEELTEIIAKGKPPMPKYAGKLSDEKIQDVLAYIRTMAK